MVKQQPNAARYRLAAQSPWLCFYQDETLIRLRRLAQWSKPERRKEDDSEQMERLGWMLALPDDGGDDAKADEPPHRDVEVHAQRSGK